MLLQSSLVQSETCSISRIWTLVAEFISYDDKCLSSSKTFHQKFKAVIYGIQYSFDCYIGNKQVMYIWKVY